ncbi:MAG TPA: hypothetical protein VMI54_07680 [Polyangiaceae bacterium]|nr:hypothetical protein [Polyangiaceae bacterium]
MPEEGSEKSTSEDGHAEDALPADAPSETRAAEEPAGSASGEPTSAPRRKRKKKKRAPEAPPEPVEPALTPDGRERPIFVLGFPHDPALDRLVRAFEVGNYAYVREQAPKLAEQTTNEDVRAAARELARRIEPDPLVKILLGLSIALLVALAVWAYKTHGA